MRFPIWPCSLRGLPSCSSRPEHWCALTAPFHPYRSRAGTSWFPPREGIRRYLFCGTFLPVTGTGCYPAQCPVESGLSSPLFRGQRPSFLLRPAANLAQRPKDGQRPSPSRPPPPGPGILGHGRRHRGSGGGTFSRYAARRVTGRAAAGSRSRNRRRTPRAHTAAARRSHPRHGTMLHRGWRRGLGPWSRRGSGQLQSSVP